MPPDTPSGGGLGSALGAAAPLVGLGLGAIQDVVGFIQAGQAKKNISKLMSEREANLYQIPDAVKQAVNLATSYASGDTATRNYETGQLDNAFSESLGSATKLGADQNDLSALFGQKIQGLMRIGDEFHKSNTEAVSGVLNAYKTLGDNQDAVWKSKDDLLRDKLAAAGANLQAGTQNISGGTSNIVSSISAAALGNLYKPKTAAPVDFNSLLANFFNNSSSSSTTKESAGTSTATAPALPSGAGYIDPNAPNPPRLGYINQFQTG